MLITVPIKGFISYILQKKAMINLYTYIKTHTHTLVVLHILCICWFNKKHHINYV